METIKYFCCWPCRSGPLSFVASIPQSGYVPGEVISIKADISNMTNVAVNQVIFTLRKIILYQSQVPHSKIKKEMVSIKENRTEGVAKKDKGTVVSTLVIPPLPPSSGFECKVISISYEVIVQAKTSGPHFSPTIEIPITIGTIPLNRGYPQPIVPMVQTNTTDAAQNPPFAVPTAPPFLNAHVSQFSRNDNTTNADLSSSYDMRKL